MSMTLIQEQVLGSAAPSVTFGSIPQTYTDLVLEVVGTNSAIDVIALRFNGDTGANYSYTAVGGNGTSAYSNRGTGSVNAGLLYTSPTGQFLVVSNIMSYANTSAYKTQVTRRNLPGGEVGAVVTLWRNTAAITSILAFNASGNTFAAASTFRLWGIA